MTKERRFAVKMWRSIAEAIRRGEIDGYFDMHNYKRRYCEYGWHNYCWACHYASGCERCPLYKKYGKDCNTEGNPYGDLFNRDYMGRCAPYEGREEEFASYADDIADTLEGR